MSGTPTDQDHVELRSSEDLALRLDLLRGSIGQAVADWADRVRTESIEPLASSMRGAARAHVTLLEELGDQNQVEGLSTYRRRLRREVLEPLETSLAAVALEERLTAAHDSLHERLSVLTDEVDEEIIRPEPGGRFLPEPTDSWMRRVRKTWVRSRRKARRAEARLGNSFRRMAGRPRNELKVYLQRIPLQQLVAYHARVRIPADVERSYDEICTMIGRAVLMTGRAVTRHVYAALDEDDVAKPARDFEEQLTSAADLLDTFDFVADAHERSERRFAELDRDTREIDSFMLDLSRRAPAKRGTNVDEQIREWGSWYVRVTERIGLMRRLLDLEEQYTEIQRSMVNRIAEKCVGPVREILEKVEERLDRGSRRAEKDFRGRATVENVQSRLDDSLAAVEREALDHLRNGEFIEEIREANSEFAAALEAVVAALPEKWALNVQDERDEPDPSRPPKYVELREQAERAFDAKLLEDLHFETERLAHAVAAAREEVARVPGILRFNLESALEDLDARSDRGNQASAYELVVDGLARSADVLGGANRLVDEAFEYFIHRSRELLNRRFEALHNRLRVEEKVREQILDLRSEAQERLRRITKRATARGLRAAALGRTTYRGVSRRFRRWIQLGQEAAGLAAATEDDRFVTLNAVREIDQVLAELPLVYRRLFTFDPLRDPSLLVGREADTQAVRAHLERRARGTTAGLVVTGSHGSGHTSFMNVLRQTVFVDSSVALIDLRQRLRTEKQLVVSLAQALGIHDTPASTLDELAQGILSRPSNGKLQACVVEHLEHLYLRKVGGTELVQSFFTFVSQTGPRLLWLLTVSSFGWQIIRTTEPAAAQLLVVHTLTSISRSALEAAIMKRHQRSGLSLHFAPIKPESNPLLARKLRKARTEQEQQDILRTEYFERLERFSGGNIMLALFYWLRSLRLSEDSDRLHVLPIEPLSLGFLQALSVDHVFTLKSLLEHATLSVQEHSELSLMPAGRSVEIFEALSSLHLIEPVEKRPTRMRSGSSELLISGRYRIRPLFIHPIIQFLRAKNVVH